MIDFDIFLFLIKEINNEDINIFIKIHLKYLYFVVPTKSSLSIQQLIVKYFMA
jgi:hypothetical protein